MRKYLSTGIIIFLPIAFTFWVASFLFDAFTDPIYKLIRTFILSHKDENLSFVTQYEMLLTFTSRVIALILLCCFLIIIGFIGRRYFFKSISSRVDNFMQKIPFVGFLYSLMKDVTKAMIGSETPFKQSVLLPFTSPNTYTFGFVTGTPSEALAKSLENIEISVFVPTAPHPISGYVLFTSKKNVVEIDASTEDVFKFLVSCGVVHPEKKPDILP